jgi:hypothetical protein
MCVREPRQLLGFAVLTRIIKAVALWVPDRSGLVRPICCLLILWAGIDSQAFQLSQTGLLPLGSNSPLVCPEGSDNDEMLIVVSDAKSIAEKNPSLCHEISPGQLSQTFRSSDIHPLWTHHLTCEHDHRNGFGAPLLC